MSRPKPHIETDFADPLPIGEGELALIEAYFGATIAALADEAPLPDAPSDPTK